MEKDRSRGIKHLKDKRKYKGNTVKNPKYVPQKSQPNLGSNWDRYESEEDDEDKNVADTSTDFAILADAPITKGKHFQSKRDKLLAEETKSVSLTGLFSLNLEKLEESLLTIPFYERVDIDKKYFLDNHIEYMNSEAKECLKKYNEIHTIKPSENLSSESYEETEEDERIIPTVEEIDNIEEINEQKNKEGKESKNKVNKSEELEQWLDDFLND